MIPLLGDRSYLSMLGLNLNHVSKSSASYVEFLLKKGYHYNDAHMSYIYQDTVHLWVLLEYPYARLYYTWRICIL